MPKYKSRYQTLAALCSTVGCKNVPTKLANDMPFCTYCFDKMIEAGMVQEYQNLPTLNLEYKKGVRHG